MGFGKKKAELPPPDSSAWLLDNSLADFVLMHTEEIRFMCLLGYTYMHGSKLFASLPAKCAWSYKFISMILQCTGGGIMVPILVNGIPVPLSNDMYPIAIMIAFLLHNYVPVLREVMKLSTVFRLAVTVLYESTRAYVVCKLTAAAGAAIAPSLFSIALFGPIFCGTIGGCGGAFLPFNKGLDPIKEAGMGPPMLSAFVASTFYHLFLNTSLSQGIQKAPEKAKFIVALFFIVHHFYVDLASGYHRPAPKRRTSRVTIVEDNSKKSK